MFVLRRITSQNLERNTVLGESYLLIDKEKNKNDFEVNAKSFNWSDSSLLNDVYGFISYYDGIKYCLIPLYKKSHYFVMLANGQTFSNISFK